MNRVNLLKILDNKTVARLQDIERITGYDSKYAKVLMSRLVKQDLVKKIMRNSFTTKSDIWTIASNIAAPAYISFWSAASFLGYTEQKPSTITVATTRKIKSIRFEGYIIKFIPIKKYIFGYKKISSSEGDIFIPEDEKLIIDLMLRPEECANPEEIESIISETNISKEKIITFLNHTRNQTLIKRVGFMLEKIKKMDLSREFNIDNNYIKLYPNIKKYSGNSNKSEKNTKWRIIL